MIKWGFGKREIQCVPSKSHSLIKGTNHSLRPPKTPWQTTISYWTENRARWDRRKAAIQQLLEGYHREAPFSQPKLAVPLSVPRCILHQGAAFVSEKDKVIGDFTLIAFNYLLRVGEYRTPTTARWIDARVEILAW